MKFLLEKSIGKIDYPYLIVCEGMGDAGFISFLLRRLAIENIRIGFPSHESAGGQGVDRISAYLRAIRAQEVVNGVNLEGLLVVVDADGDAVAAERKISAALAGAEFPVPSKPHEIQELQRHGSSFRVGLYILPGPLRTGTLEELLLQAVQNQDPQKIKCVDEFLECCGTEPQTPNQRAKMRLSALVAVHCKSNPWASLSVMWSERDNPVNIDDASFDLLKSSISALSRGKA